MKNNSSDGKKLNPVDVAVIGAGMAGLSAAVYARKAGLSVRIFEQHFLPGGLCTAWKRKGFIFDYCVHYFFGSGKKHALYKMWEELGVIETTEFQHMDTFGQYIGADGRVLNLYTNYKKLQDHLLSIAPEDTKKIKEFCKAIRRAGTMQIADFSFSFRNLLRIIKIIPALPVLKKWSDVTVHEWCEGLKNPFLKEAIPPVIGFVDFPCTCPIIAFALMNNDSIGYPLGGSLPIALLVAEKAVSLKARIEYRAKVQKIITKDGKAIGLKLEDGRIQNAKHIVAACDAHAVFEKLLEGKIQDPVYTKMFETAEIQPALVQVSLGVSIDPVWKLKDMSNRTILAVKKPIHVDTAHESLLGMHHYAHDPKMAPKGSTSIVIRYKGDFDYWEKLNKNKPAYNSEKKRILTDTINALEEHFPGIKNRVVATDVATPTSCARYTNNWRGSMQGWVLTKDLMKKMFSGNRPPKIFSELKNIYLIGQWTEPNGGLPPAAKSGRDIVCFLKKQ